MLKQLGDLASWLLKARSLSLAAQRRINSPVQKVTGSLLENGSGVYAALKFIEKL